MMPNSSDLPQKSNISQMAKEIAEQQIIKERKIVDYDTSEPSVLLLIQRFIRPNVPEDIQDSQRDIYIPPYQRRFVWSEDRQSKFIESVILGLPIPFMFMADRPDGKWEVVDGSQRLQTLDRFLSGGLRLQNLQRLHKINNFYFDDLPLAQQRKFRNQTIRVIVLSDSADEVVRKEIFERINTGSDTLKDAEVRRGAYSGPFYDFYSRCSKNQKFVALCPLGETKEARGEREELALRFFAYSEKYLDFKHEVKNFLDDYVKEKNDTFDDVLMEYEFNRMLDFVEKYFPFGFAKTKNAKSTPRVRFEAISIGVNLALREEPDLVPSSLDWLNSEKFKKYTTSDASNSSSRLRDRIEYVKKALHGIL